MPAMPIFSICIVPPATPHALASRYIRSIGKFLAVAVSAENLHRQVRHVHHHLVGIGLGHGGLVYRREPLPAPLTARYTRSRAASSLMAMSTIMNCMAWNSHIGLPKAFRSMA